MGGGTQIYTLLDCLTMVSGKTILSARTAIPERSETFISGILLERIERSYFTWPRCVWRDIRCKCGFRQKAEVPSGYYQREVSHGRSLRSASGDAINASPARRVNV